MRIYDLIEKKKRGFELSKEEIEFIIDGYVDGSIPDYQISALLMAIYFNKMTHEETVNLTMTMAKSGDMLDLSKIEGVKTDKHSTGGVGDKTSLVLAPMIASLGVPVAKMSGRGLGHTGGTIDKLESIEGFKTGMDTDTFINQVNTIKIALTGQTGNLVPADKKLYALRDVTATVDNISLIASSIMSKKIAAGADAIVLDVKSGDGTFMKTDEDAKKLAKEMVSIGNSVGRKTFAVVSNMDQPLGNAVGNSLEVIEAIETLKNRGSKEVLELCVEIGSYMVVAANKAKDVDEAKKMLLEVVENNKAIEKFKEWVKAQGGNVAFVDDYSLFGKADKIIEVRASFDGYVKKIKCEDIGIASMLLGGGRSQKEDKIDMNVGIILNKKVSDEVKKGDVLATVYANERYVEKAVNKVYEAYEIVPEKVEKPELIKMVIM